MTGLCDFYGRRAGATAIFARWRSPNHIAREYLGFAMASGFSTPRAALIGWQSLRRSARIDAGRAQENSACHAHAP